MLTEPVVPQRCRRACHDRLLNKATLKQYKLEPSFSCCLIFFCLFPSTFRTETEKLRTEEIPVSKAKFTLEQNESGYYETMTMSYSAHTLAKTKLLHTSFMSQCKCTKNLFPIHMSTKDKLPFSRRPTINSQSPVFLLKIFPTYLSSKVKDLTTTAADGLVTSFLSNQCLQGKKKKKSNASKTAFWFFLIPQAT